MPTVPPPGIPAPVAAPAVAFLQLDPQVRVCIAAISAQSAAQAVEEKADLLVEDLARGDRMVREAQGVLDQVQAMAQRLDGTRRATEDAARAAEADRRAAEQAREAAKADLQAAEQARADAERQARENAERRVLASDDRAKRTAERARRQTEEKKGQGTLAGVTGAEAGIPFTVEALVATLQDGSGGVFRCEKTLKSVAVMLGRQIKELVQSKRNLDDIRLLAGYIGQGQLTQMAGGGPSIALLARIGVLEELIEESQRWLAAGRPSPQEWNRGRAKARSARGWQPASSREDISNDPAYRAGQVTEGGAMGINPWKTDDDGDEKDARGRPEEATC
jgi:hypothetical protein